MKRFSALKSSAFAAKTVATTAASKSVKYIRFFLKLFIIIALTIITQIGGVIYFFVELIPLRRFRKYRWIKIILFSVLYLAATYIAVPKLAPKYGGREAIYDTPYLKPHSFITKLLNRNYVTHELNQTLKIAGVALHHKYEGIYLAYLDANFPFIDRFPLLPHHSHNDGKKVDLAFVYTTPNGQYTNKKPSISGYGAFEEPKAREQNQTAICKDNGHWRYNYTQFASLGTIYPDLLFSKDATKFLLQELTKRKEVQKIFIEPHLKYRLGIKSSKVRFQGCNAVRHDDHIHLQIH